MRFYLKQLQNYKKFAAYPYRCLDFLNFGGVRFPFRQFCGNKFKRL